MYRLNDFLSQKPLSAGGEASIYSAGSGLVAKIYNSRVDLQEKASKIETMLKIKFPSSTSSQIAWPIDAVYDDEDKVCGFVMKEVHGKRLDDIYCKRITVDELSKVRLAKNLCCIFQTLKENIRVIGDANGGNFLFSESTGELTAIDTDSFQITTDEVEYRCNVGMEQYLSPELARKFAQYNSLSDMPEGFTVETDAFALAIHIFQLLMDGYHPFQCASSASFVGSVVNIDLGSDIINKKCLYFEKVSGRTTPPGSPGIDILPMRLQELFRRSFYDEENRPTPLEYFDALEEYENEMIRCKNNSNHFYYGKLSSCPFCKANKKIIQPITTVDIMPVDNYVRSTVEYEETGIGYVAINIILSSLICVAMGNPFVLVLLFVLPYSLLSMGKYKRKGGYKRAWYFIIPSIIAAFALHSLLPAIIIAILMFICIIAV